MVLTVTAHWMHNSIILPTATMAIELRPSAWPPLLGLFGYCYSPSSNLSPIPEVRPISHTRWRWTVITKVLWLARDCIIYQLRFALPTFLQNALKASSPQHRFFLFRTNGWKSLSVLTGLLTLEFGTLFLASRLVSIANNKVCRTRSSILCTVIVFNWTLMDPTPSI